MLEAGGDEERAIRAFLDPPTYNRNFEHSFGTLYTAVMRPAERCIDYRWPSRCGASRSPASRRASARSSCAA